MARYIPIQRSVHKDAGWTARQDLSFATDMALVPLLAEELSHALSYMAIAFTENKQANSGYDLVGIQSLQPGKNMMISPDGRWMAGYIPAFYRGYPFAMIQEEGTDKLHLCIDANSALFHETAEEGDTLLLAEDGTLSERVREIVNFLQQCHINKKLTQQLLLDLKTAGLITSWAIKRQQATQDAQMEQAPVTGLFHINKQALENISPDTLVSLNKSGALLLAYSQILSEPRLKNLSSFHQIHQQAAQQQASASEANLEQLFGKSTEEDDIFKF